MTASESSHRPLLAPWSGTFSSTNRLWFTPDSPAFESPITMAIAPVVGDAITELRYQWSHDGREHDGVLLVRDLAADAPSMMWVDSFHTGVDFMLFKDGTRTDRSLAASGHYPAPPGPDWGWRIELHVEDDGPLLLRMYNITPEGEEALAVEARFGNG